MSHFGLKIKKSESPDKTPYTVYYPHSIPITERKWTQPYYQFVSIDPAGKKNYAMRIERRYNNGWITPVVFDKVPIYSIRQEGETLIKNTFEVLTEFLTKYQEFYEDCHFIIIERQLPQNYQATRVMQHTITYFSLKLHNKILLPAIIEVDPKLKGKALGAPKGINEKQLKVWSVEKSRELLIMRKDDFSLKVLDHFRTKQDDLADTIAQIEAICCVWGFPLTGIPPDLKPDGGIQEIKPISLRLVPINKIENWDDIPDTHEPNNAPTLLDLIKSAPKRTPATPIKSLVLNVLK